MKCALARLQEVDGTEGWQRVTLSTYDVGGKHPVYPYGECQAVLASPERLKTKVPNYLAADQSNMNRSARSPWLYGPVICSVS